MNASVKLNEHDYAAWLHHLKERIRSARVSAALAVNSELVLLYWEIGKSILGKQQQQGWGAKIINRLAKELHLAFPEIKGFSPRNLKYMRAFAEAWPEQEFVQQVAAQLPWFHNCVLLDKVRDPAARRWYITKTIEQGWARSVLIMQIETRLYEREGKAVTNFTQRLPTLQSDLEQFSLRLPRCRRPLAVRFVLSSRLLRVASY